MLKPQSALLGFECELNQVHGTPFHLAMLALANEVYEDGNGSRRHASHAVCTYPIESMSAYGCSILQ